MKKTVLLIIITGLFLACKVLAQVPGDTLWTKIYGGTDFDMGNSVQQTTDGGYIIAGRTISFGAGNEDVYLIKTNSLGDTLWTKTYGGIDSDVGNSVQQTTDGGYIIAGMTNSFGAGGGGDTWLIKTNVQGDTLWTKTYGGIDYDEGWSVQQTTDGGYIISGNTASFGAGLNDVWLIKTNSLGDTLWTKTYGGLNYDEGYSVQQTTDDGYIIAGSTLSFGAGFSDVWLIKTNSLGDTLWTKTYGGTGYDVGFSVQQTTNGGYIITGYKRSYGAGDDDVWLIKTESNGDIHWTRVYGGEGNDVAYSVKQTSDGGFILAGYTDSFGPSMISSFYVVRTDATGDTIWTHSYGRGMLDKAMSVDITSDGAYAVAGYSIDNSWNFDCWLLKVSGESQSPLNPPQNLFVTEKAYAIWEAPSSKDLLGYNIYLDSNFIEYTTDLFYQYEDLINEQTYVAGVSAVYDEGESEIVEYEFTCIFVGVDEWLNSLNFSLSQNYPNPFSNKTTIHITTTVASDKNTTITIYSFNGQKIKTLVDKKLSAGTHQIVWDGT
ncbi:MAG: hypothetical protein KAT38_14615, partial [Bacteroidales bacterium]|nr:hypothetical protein [Bacteroidales bacterium]